MLVAVGDLLDHQFVKKDRAGAVIGEDMKEYKGDEGDDVDPWAGSLIIAPARTSSVTSFRVEDNEAEALVANHGRRRTPQLLY